MLEFKIDVEDTPEKHVDALILGLVRSGYSVYLGEDNKSVYFDGWSDDIITQKVEVIE
jgi:hypothetical protein